MKFLGSKSNKPILPILPDLPILPQFPHLMMLLQWGRNTPYYSSDGSNIMPTAQ